MSTLKEVKAKFPDAYSCGGELMLTVNGRGVVLASMTANSFTLTEKGRELFEEVVEVIEPEPTKPRGRKKVEKPETATDVEAVQTDDLDSLLGD